MKRFTILIVISLCLMSCSNSEEVSGRSIKAYQFDGDVNYVREKQREAVYKDMCFISEDLVNTEKESYLTMAIDEDKYLYVGEDSKVHLESAGENNYKTKVILDEGTIVSTLENKLSDEESYEVQTANATISVRGTTFKVNYDGETNVYCYKGKVEVEDGTGNTMVLEEGMSTSVTENGFEKAEEDVILSTHFYDDVVSSVRLQDYDESLEHVNIEIGNDVDVVRIFDNGKPAKSILDNGQFVPYTKENNSVQLGLNPYEEHNFVCELEQNGQSYTLSFYINASIAFSNAQPDLQRYLACLADRDYCQDIRYTVY